MNQFFLSPLLADFSEQSIQSHVQQQRITSDFLNGRVSVSDYLEYLETDGVDIDAYLGEVEPLIEEIISGNIGIDIV